MENELKEVDNRDLGSGKGVILERKRNQVIGIESSQKKRMRDKEIQIQAENQNYSLPLE